MGNVCICKEYFLTLHNSYFLNSRQLGHKGNAKLVSLVQGLSHQVHLFLVEYNKVNHLQLNLPGFKPRNANLNHQINKRNSNSNSNSGENNVPEDVLHQQRLLLQSCDRLKLTVSRNQPQSEVVDVITQLGATFTKLIELMLSKEIKVSFKSNSLHNFLFLCTV
jgi:hypothetical protein